MYGKVTVYIWLASSSQKKGYGHLAIETKNIYVSFRPNDVPSNDKNNPFLYSREKDLEIEARAPDVTYELTCLDDRLLENELTQFARSGFDKTGIFDPKKQTVFWEQILGQVNLIKDMVDFASKLANKTKFFTHVNLFPKNKLLSSLKGINKILEFLNSKDPYELEKEAAYNWITFAFFKLCLAGLLSYVHPKEPCDKSFWGYFKRNAVPAYLSAMMPGFGIPLIFFILLRDQYIDASATRYTESELDNFLRSAMAAAPKDSIKRFERVQEVAIRLFIAQISFQSPAKRAANIKQLSKEMSKLQINIQDKILSEIPEEIRKQINVAMKPQEKPTLLRAKL